MEGRPPGAEAAQAPCTLVTGATGFLGRHLLPRLPRPVALVRSLERWEALPFRRELGAVATVEGSVEEWESWLPHLASARVSTVVHLAALVRHSREDAAEVYRVNVDGTLAMVRAAARLGARLVTLTTSGTVGCFRSAGARADERSPHCQEEIRGWPYYDSKRVAEIEAGRLALELGVELVIVRAPVLLGPGDHRGRSTGHLRRFLARRMPFILSGGIAFADVRDVAAGIAAIVATPRPRPVYHLTGTSCTLGEFFGMCSRIAGIPPPRFQLPRQAALLLARAGQGLALLGARSPFPDPVVVEMASRHWGVTSLWAHELGYAPRPASETLRDTIEWLRASEG